MILSPTMRTIGFCLFSCSTALIVHERTTGFPSPPFSLSLSQFLPWLACGVVGDAWRRPSAAANPQGFWTSLRWSGSRSFAASLTRAGLATGGSIRMRPNADIAHIAGPELSTRCPRLPGGDSRRSCSLRPTRTFRRYVQAPSISIRRASALPALVMPPRRIVLR